MGCNCGKKVVKLKTSSGLRKPCPKCDTKMSFKQISKPELGQLRIMTCPSCGYKITLKKINGKWIRISIK